MEDSTISILIKIPILTVGVRNPQKYRNGVQRFRNTVRYDLDPVTDALQVLALFFWYFFIVKRASHLMFL